MTMMSIQQQQNSVKLRSSFYYNNNECNLKRSLTYFNEAKMFMSSLRELIIAAL